MTVNELTDPDLKGWEISDEKDEWGALKVKVFINGVDDTMWRRIKRYVSAWDGWTAEDLRSGWFYLYSSFYSVKKCPKGEYKLHMETLDRLVEDLKDLFPYVEGRGKVYKKRYEFLMLTDKQFEQLEEKLFSAVMALPPTEGATLAQLTEAIATLQTLQLPSSIFEAEEKCANPFNVEIVPFGNDD